MVTILCGYIVTLLLSLRVNKKKIGLFGKLGTRFSARENSIVQYTLHSRLLLGWTLTNGPLLRPPKRVMAHTRWSCPPVGWCSITFDGALDEDTKVEGFGVASRERASSLFMGFSLAVQQV